MTEETQMRKDLCNRIEQWLNEWMKRSHDLYKMGELTDEEVITDVLYLMIRQTARTSAWFNVPKENMCAMLRDAITYYEERDKDNKAAIVRARQGL